LKSGAKATSDFGADRSEVFRLFNFADQARESNADLDCTIG
jgi:hypothetical protein